MNYCHIFVLFFHFLTETIRGTFFHLLRLFFFFLFFAFRIISILFYSYKRAFFLFLMLFSFNKVCPWIRIKFYLIITLMRLFLKYTRALANMCLYCWWFFLFLCRSFHLIRYLVAGYGCCHCRLILQLNTQIHFHLYSVLNMYVCKTEL